MDRPLSSVPATFSRPQRDALAWVYAQMTRRRRALWRQPHLATLNRLRDLGLITFGHHVAHRMTVITDPLLTDAGQLAYAQEWAGGDR